MLRSVYGRAGCVAVGLWCAGAGAQPPGHGVHPVLPDVKFFLHVWPLDTNAPTVTDIPLRIRSASIPETLDQSLAWGESGASLRVVKYLPSAELTQSVSADDGGGAPPAIELAIEGPAQSFRRWLVADDPERNRLISYIATWRFIAARSAQERDVLFRQFENEMTRPATLRVGPFGSEKWSEFPVEVGRVQKATDSEYTVQVREFFSDYAMDRATGTPTNQSERNKNPAALVEIEYQGVKEARWVFAKFPDFGRAGAKKLPFRVDLDCPIESESRTPDFCVVAIERANLEVWTRVNAQTTAGPLTLDARVGVPGSQYAFRAASFLPSGRLIEAYESTAPGKGRPAVEVEFASGDAKTQTLWLGLGHSRRAVTSKGAVLVSFDDVSGSSSGPHP